MFTYSQRTGEIRQEGVLIGKGYSGHDTGLNNPGLEGVRGVGPIPLGNWSIVDWFDCYPGKGPIVAKLLPIEHEAHGRSGFLIHGDNAALNNSASHGCIVASREIREKWRASNDRKLQVIL